MRAVAPSGAIFARSIWVREPRHRSKAYLLALKPAGRGAGLYVTVIVGFYHLIIQRLHSEYLSHNVGQGYSLETPVFDTRKSFLLDQTNTSKIRCFMWVFAYNNK